MRRKQQDDVIKLFLDFQKRLSAHSITIEKKFKEIKMMNFKIRPLQGDIASLNLRDMKLIDALWNLGKLDEFFQKEYPKLRFSQKKTFYQLFDNFQQRYQEKLNNVNVQTAEELSLATTIEMEIFKEQLPKKRLN